MRRGAWLALAAIVVIGLAADVGVGTLVWRAHVDAQPTVSDDVPYLDQAIAAVVAGAGEDAAVAVAGVVAARACQPAALISGAEFTRTAELFVNPGEEDALLSRIAGRLPGEFHARRSPAPDKATGPVLASAAHGVELTVQRLTDGWVLASARTRCTTRARQQADNAVPRNGSAVVEGILATLGTRAAAEHQEIVPCTTGRIVTLAAISEPTTTGGLADRLAGQLPATVHPYATTANRVAYRDQGSSFIVAASDDGTEITVRQTTGC